jgi:hypothetical protein
MGPPRDPQRSEGERARLVGPNHLKEEPRRANPKECHPERSNSETK